MSVRCAPGCGAPARLTPARLVPSVSMWYREGWLTCSIAARNREQSPQQWPDVPGLRSDVVLLGNREQSETQGLRWRYRPIAEGLSGRVTYTSSELGRYG